jgi:hypothetical protein
MADKIKSVLIEMTTAEFEQLQARAYPKSANVTDIAHELICAGLTGADNKALAERLMMIERRIVAIEQQVRDLCARTQSIDQSAGRLLAMFEALLKALTGEGEGRRT